MKQIIKSTKDAKPSYRRILVSLVLFFFIIATVAYLIQLLWFAFVPPQQLTIEESEQRIEEITKAISTEKDSDNNQSELLDFELSDTVLFIPRIDLNLGIFTGDESTLEKGIWNRYPERTASDNLILTGHRFTIGSNIFGYQRKSPLVHIEVLENGDKIYIINKDNTTEYVVTKTFKVEPDETWIEDNDLESYLTIYSCTLGGAKDGRYVVRAELVK